MRGGRRSEGAGAGAEDEEDEGEEGEGEEQEEEEEETRMSTCPATTTSHCTPGTLAIALRIFAAACGGRNQSVAGLCRKKKKDRAERFGRRLWQEPKARASGVF